MTSTTLLIKNYSPHHLYIIPFGGCGEFGMNLTAYHYGSRTYVVDCGVMFPDPTKLGVDCVIPDVREFLKELGGVTAYFLTHGHEDHIGALPYLIRHFPAPIYATAWTHELLRLKFEKLKILDQYPVCTTQHNDATIIGDIKVSWVHVNHSIPMTCSLFIETPAGNVFHTGDFKIEKHPIKEPTISLPTLTEIAKRGVDIFITDSTNAHLPGFSKDEQSVFEPLKTICKDIKGRIFLTTFASNLWRLQTVIHLAKELNRKVFIVGKGMETTIKIAAKLRLIEDFNLVVFEGEQPNSKCNLSNLIVLTTGCQGEYLAGLTRIIYGAHKMFSLNQDDTVIFSSRIIPGNERPILNLLNECEKTNVRTFTTKSHPDIHVSGHGYQQEIKTFLDYLKPKYFAPVHGSFFHMRSNLKLAEQSGYQADQTIFLENGSVLQFYQDRAQIIDKLEIERLFIDSSNGLELEKSVLRQRLKIGELGLAVLFGIWSSKQRDFLIPPDIQFTGLPDVEDIYPNLLNNARTAVLTDLTHATSGHKLDETSICETARLSLRRYLANVFSKKPVVIANIRVVEDTLFQ